MKPEARAEAKAVPVELAGVRRRLEGATGRTYWKSLEELAGDPAVEDMLRREFPEQASMFDDPLGRRQFLTLMGASLALAGLTGCTRQPEEKVVPYVKPPEGVIAGRPLFFATAVLDGGYAKGPRDRSRPWRSGSAHQFGGGGLADAGHRLISSQTGTCNSAWKYARLGAPQWSMGL